MESSRVGKYIGVQPGCKRERRGKKSTGEGAVMEGQPNPVSGLRIPEGAQNPFSLQPRAGKQGMNK